MTKDRILYNGKLTRPEAVNLGIKNRGFRYGDGLFETMRMFDGKMPFLEIHLERLNSGIEMLEMELPFQIMALIIGNMRFGGLLNIIVKNIQNKRRIIEFA
ncbi:MAG: hypothetical protein HC803_06240 [Saprospiraceae bacterium]|nr:hypothetical protein [Saprospiraceae bacterium]